MALTLAYLAQGRLFLFDQDRDKSELIDSQYGQDVVKRALERQAKNEWKTAGNGSVALFSRQSLWGADSDKRAINVRTTAVISGVDEDELVYVVSTESVGGLFSYNLKSKKETRLFHKENLYLTDLCRQKVSSQADKTEPAGNTVACQRFPNGTARIVLVRKNGVDEVTEGDSVDEAPKWIPNRGKQIVYQSAGVARNQAGLMVGLGHATVQKLDLENGNMETVLENEKYDYLSPSMAENGDLYCIRRPYEPIFSRNYPVHKILLDTILFPFRLARAFFHYLNFFSIAFSKKPLTTAAGPKLEGLDEKELFLRGRKIDAEKFLEQQGTQGDAPALVPKEWQLIRKAENGSESVLADSVLSFDISGEETGTGTGTGTIVYTTGMAVYQMDRDGKNKKLLFKNKLADTVIILS